MPQTGLEDKKNHNERRELFSVCYPWTVSDASQLCWMKAWLQSDEHFCLYKCNHEILHIQSQMYLSSHNLTWLCQLASFCAGLRKQSVFLCIWTDNFLWLFLETWGWTFVVFFFFRFFRKWNFRVPHWVLTACFIPYVSSVIITPGWFTLLSKCICLDAYCGELSNCITLKAQAGWSTADA